MFVMAFATLPASENAAVGRVRKPPFPCPSWVAKRTTMLLCGSSGLIVTYVGAAS